MDKFKRIFDRYLHNHLTEEQAKLELIRLIASDYCNLKQMAEVYVEACKKGEDD